jgi:hypothetical protein
LQHQDQACIDEDEDISYETAMTHFSTPQADASRQQQTQYQLDQLKRNLRQEKESLSSSSQRYVEMPPIVPTAQSTMDCYNTEDTVSAIRRNSQSFNGLMNPNKSINRIIFPDDDGSCSSITVSERDIAE